MFVVGLHAPAHAGVAKVVGTLVPGTSVFWAGSKVGSYTERLSGLPATVSGDCLEAGKCFTYSLKLAKPGGARLRVAIDVPERRDSFRFTAVDPKGNTTSDFNFNAFDAELFVDKPMAGMWKIVVAPLTAQYSTFRLRAKLEKTVYGPPKSAKMWAPNLVVPRIWDFGFVSPVTGLAGFSFDDANPPVDAAGVHPFSCTLDEMSEGAHRCLRFSFQLANAGPGNFDVRFNTESNPLTGKMVQCVERPGKAPFARDAGEFAFHEVHGHYHYQDVVLHRLFRVTNTKTGAMTPAGVGEKLGYHPADQSFADWGTFVQGASGTSASAGNCYAGSNDQIGLSRGWGDAYRWQRPGNFVEFGNNPNGFYVVRTTADPKAHLLEASEADNDGYAYIRVVGEEVNLIETGRGTSPWDPHKVVNANS
jgi:hypothetical protein